MSPKLYWNSWSIVVYGVGLKHPCLSSLEKTATDLYVIYPELLVHLAAIFQLYLGD